MSFLVVTALNTAFWAFLVCLVEGAMWCKRHRDATQFARRLEREWASRRVVATFDEIQF